MSETTRFLLASTLRLLTDRRREIGGADPFVTFLQYEIVGGQRMSHFRGQTFSLNEFLRIYDRSENYGVA